MVKNYSKKLCIAEFFSKKPSLGIEPRTFRLQVWRSATKLRRLLDGFKTWYHRQIKKKAKPKQSWFCVRERCQKFWLSWSHMLHSLCAQTIWHPFDLDNRISDHQPHCARKEILAHTLFAHTSSIAEAFTMAYFRGSHLDLSTMLLAPCSWRACRRTHIMAHAASLHNPTAPWSPHAATTWKKSTLLDPIWHCWRFVSSDPHALAHNRKIHSQKQLQPHDYGMSPIVYSSPTHSNMMLVADMWSMWLVESLQICHIICKSSDMPHWVHSSVVRAADCRSAGPWFKSGCALLSQPYSLLPHTQNHRHRHSY